MVKLGMVIIPVVGFVLAMLLLAELWAAIYLSKPEIHNIMRIIP